MVSLELRVGRHSGVPLETRGAIGRYDGARDVLELHGAAKVPHWNRDQIARMLGMPPSRVHLYEGHVGGGFGIRGELYPEDVLVCAAALPLPPAGEMDRGSPRAPDRRQPFAPAAAIASAPRSIADGRILGIDDEFFHDQGAYVRTHAATVPDLAAAMLPGPYRVPAYRAVGHIRLTNKTPGGTYRAPGRFESTFVRERLLDAIAARVGIDGVEVRRRNLIAVAEMPYARPIETLGTDVTFDSGDYQALLDKTLAAMNWQELRRDVQQRREAGEAGRYRAWHVRREKRSRSVRRRAGHGRHVGRCRGRYRRGLGRAGRRNRHRPDLRRCARGRLSARPRRARPDRPDRLWHGRIRLARDGDDRRSDPPRGHEGSRQGHRGRGRTAAGAAGSRSISSTAMWFAPVPPAGPSVALGEVARSPVAGLEDAGQSFTGADG